MTDVERINQLEVVLAALLEQVGCYDDAGERVDPQVPAVQQARLVLGPEAWRRVMGVAPET